MGQTKSFVLKIDLENDVFAEYPQFEIARILRELADSIEADDINYLKRFQNIREVSGNICGDYAIKRNVQIKTN